MKRNAEKYCRIDLNYTIREVKEHPAFEGFGECLSTGVAERIRQLNGIKLGELNTVAASWGVHDIVEGLNHLMDLAVQKSSIAWDYWDDLSKEKEPSKKHTKLLYLPGEKNRPFVVICSGGSYRVIATMMEGLPAAKRLNELGYNVFLLNYRVGTESLLPDPVDDLCQAINFIISNSQMFQVNKEHYAVMGFSAGGHLAAEYGTDNLGYMNAGLPKPDLLVLCYPLLSFKYGKTFDSAFAHRIVHNNLKSEDIEITEHMSGAYPSVYIWHCADDELVTIRNADMMSEKLEELGIPYQYKRAACGGHGLGLGTGSEVEGWIDEAVKFWIKQLEKVEV